MDNKYCIAVTGSSGSGKTTVLEMLNKMGYITKDYDLYSINVIKQLQSVHMKLQEIIKEPIVFDGELDLKGVGNYFEKYRADEMYFEEWFQPILGRCIQEDISKIRNDEIIFCDVPFLEKKGISETFQEVWIVKADFHICCERLRRRNNFSYEKAKYLVLRSRVQTGNFKKEYIIENTSSIEDLYSRLKTGLKIVHDRVTYC